MYETTQIIYGEGTITVTMSSESVTEVTAPDIRFGSYKDAVMACFTSRELENIFSGQDAQVSFSFVMSDELSDASELPAFTQAMEENSKELGALHEGVYFDVAATKSIAGEETAELGSFYEDVEMQYEIPLYLTGEDRNYFIMTDVMGVCELARDTDKDADTLTISTHSIGTSLLLYQEKKESLVPEKIGLHISSQHLFIGGIVVLALVWLFIDYSHRKHKN